MLISQEVVHDRGNLSLDHVIAHEAGHNVDGQLAALALDRVADRADGAGRATLHSLRFDQHRLRRRDSSR